MDKNGWRQADPYTRIIAAMWHRNRKDFAEWTAEEIDRRANVGMTDRMEASRRGLIRAERPDGRNNDLAIYRVTDLGRKLWGEQNASGNPGGDHPARRRLTAVPLSGQNPRGNLGSRR